jgi:outer membrane lipoprotein-sorting protein
MEIIMVRILQGHRARWLVPAGLVAALAVAVVGRPIVAGAAPSLPERTAAQLLASIATTGQQPFSGTIVETAALGLPALPNVAGAGPTSLTSLVSGSHTARVWYDGPDHIRFALLGSLAETDVVRNQRDLWIWDSAANTVQHTQLPAETKHSSSTTPSPIASALPSTPADAAAQALAAIDPTTVVTVDGTDRVAGRPVYQLVLEPRDTRSLVASVRIAVDAKTWLPLRVQVYAKGYVAPAFETGFTSVSISKPSSAEFRFTPPPGSTTKAPSPSKPSDNAPAPTAAPRSEPIVVGKGWTSVAVISGFSLSDLTGSGSQAGLMLKALTPVSGAYGSGQVLQTRLLSVLALDDGRLLVGAVPASVLEAVAASPEASAAPSTK